MRHALVRAVSPRLADCELSFVARRRIDVEVATVQHAAYVAALEALACHVVRLPALADYPDSVFVEDTALVLDELAVILRPGAVSRQGECDSIAAALAPFRPLHRIDAPATLDGGDILQLGRTLYVGQGARSNAAAVAQLRVLLEPVGYRIVPVATQGCLHLKSAVTHVAEDAVLVQPGWIDGSIFSDVRRIEVDALEAHAANAVRIDDTVLMPASFPRTRERLALAGIDTRVVDVSELQKAEGAVTCCSLLFQG
ncbi:MAG TPA: dimethylargininase [Rhodanobacteraceae bacterium]|nr:dimethylargininase [Rhodanobacteraceae bacterium]